MKPPVFIDGPRLSACFRARRRDRESEEAHGQEVYAVLFFLLVFASRTERSARGAAAGSMPRYDARPAGSFRSSLRSDPRYDGREPLDDGDSGPGSDVTESEWGIEARHLRDTANEPAEAPRRRDEQERYDERPVTAKEQYDRRVSRETLPEDEELTGWALTKKCVPATCRTTPAGIPSSRRRTDDPTGILKCDIRARLRTRVAATRARSSHLTRSRRVPRDSGSERRASSRSASRHRARSPRSTSARREPRVSRNDTNERLKAHARFFYFFSRHRTECEND